MVQSAPLETRADRGIRVILAAECPSKWEGDRPLEVVGLLRDGRVFLNDRPMDRRVLPVEIALIMETRNDPLVWVRAEPGVSYGEVFRLLSDLKVSTPELNLVLITEKQGAGPVNPVDWFAAWKSGQRFHWPYCAIGGVI